ncbi:MAG: alanine--tRNA ligase [Bacteroidales bacterium]|nr:alanine--tRNA ligase [Bacteroidales bacterium]
MNSIQIRQAFLDFFSSKQHFVANSAPMVIKNDPTLMFTNAGMNQFKDIFLGNSPANHLRIANSQKCLRVSGKHNDLEEVGHDTYHHTMFEMLGNWSFGDYFKKEAIAWGWELLTEVYGLEKNRLYVTVFGGDKADGLEPDNEAYDYWKAFVSEDRILYGSKKDNFWEMGEIGPCGPCSEIHIDLRDEDERQAMPGKDLVNNDHPQVVEIWNLVFIQFNRMNNGELKSLPAKHVDTGMGFERLCMALQGKKSNYDTDVFQPYIQKLAEMTGISYGSGKMTDVAMRVVSDHLRAVAFAIADGELPSNNKAGYVIRRILRRAIRYGYTFLEFREPFVHKLLPVMVENMGKAFPELTAQQDLISRVIAEEETTFLRTLSVGIHKFDQYLAAHPEKKVVDGQFAFELFDTYGFPIDLTRLMAREQGWEVDMEGFAAGMEAQKTRSRAAGTIETGDWVELKPATAETLFLGYDQLEAEVELIKYRRVSSKGKTYYQLVFDKTPFYAESGGQVGDRGVLESGDTKIHISDTQKENNLVVHIAEKIPQQMPSHFLAKVDGRKRQLTANNHTATHLLHAALREVLGHHVQQKGSLVNEERLRFDFSHFSRMTQEEIEKVEQIVNARIRENISQEEHREMEMAEAQNMGAMALFGEKYGDKVRVISFDKKFSTELCGGTHVHSTGQIGLFRIVSEGAIAAGIRRVEAITGADAERFVNEKIKELDAIRSLLRNPKDTVHAVEQLLEQNESLRKKLDAAQKDQAGQLVEEMAAKTEKIGGVNFIGQLVEMDAKMAKDLAFAIKNKVDNLFLVLGHAIDGKPGIVVMISENLVKERNLHAGNIVRNLAAHIQGGGGGQPFFATAGGKNPAGLDKVISEARKLLV